MSRTLIARGILTLAVGAAGLSLVGCGSERDVTADSSTASNAVSAPASEDRPSTSPPVVGGPKPRSTTAAESVSTEDEGAGQTCGQIPGPDGALRILVLAGGVTCADAKELGKEYGPKIVTGKQQSVSGWTCGPSELEGILAACVKGQQVVGFTP
ncbi:hypothetical protein QSJ18_19130 [Gordonia sp. ABSL1-1]|uniref:hypothetical protein n=1 Tax=Gordonia sp. ABSL1-1 TaxID=3053923 RepID=UPI0025730493|nr:hypothetical protein [Gordonia sp. ABSL1-1]MDL9938865.1 hypothetical protein [Gordonia sp. ABSL1-1]